MRGLPHFAIGQSLDIKRQFRQFLCQYLLFINELFVGVFQLLCDLLLFFGCRLEGFLGFGDGVLGDFGQFLLHGFVVGQFLFQFSEEFFR